MNKENFLKELEKRLKILSAEEKKDILNEYEDIITEKVKHGKTEEEAVKEFGDLKSLSEEILKSYKIDPKYQTSGNDFLNDCEDLIKKGAQKLTKVTEDVVDSIKKSDKEMDLEFIFEIVIKVILLFLAIGFLHIPFWIVGEIGQSILEGFSFGPMFFFQGNIISILWKVLIEVGYVAICALLVITVLKKARSPRFEENSKKKSNPKERRVEGKEKVQEMDKIEGTVPISVQKRTNPLSEVLLILVKLFLFFVFVIPLIMFAFFIAMILCILIYLLSKGIGMYAPFLFVLGVFTLITHIITIFTRLLFTNKKIRVWPFLGSFVMIILGGIFTIDYLWSFTYHSDFKADEYHKQEEKYEFIIDDSLYVNYDEMQIDNSLKDDQVEIVVQYYDTIVSLNKEEHSYHGEDIKRISFTTRLANKYSINHFINKIIVRDLKKQELHNYRYLFKPYVCIFVNENTKSKIW